MNDYNIKELYEEMEMQLIKSMQRNLSRHLKEESEVGFEYPQWQAIKLKELKKYQRENKIIISKYTKGLNKDVSEHLQRELRHGSLQAIKQYNKIHKNKLNLDKLMTKSFFRTNQRKVNNLIKVVNNDLNKANIGALRMINDQYRQIIHKSAFFVGNGVMTEKQASDMSIKEISEKKETMQAVDEASKNFLAGGLNCIEYKDGKRVNIASYSEMAVRTANLRAHLMGEGDFRKSIGRSLVKVTTHGGACKLCTAWQGKVLVDDVYSGGEPDGKHTLLSEAMAQGFLHPNCKHGLTTYYPELEGISYDTPETDIQEELQDKINYYLRQEKRFDRLSNGSINPDNRRMYKQKELLYEKKKDNYIVMKNDMLLYDDVTDEWLKKSNLDYQEIKNASSVLKNGKRYKVNKKNKIILENREKENGEWFVKTFGGRIEYLPVINEEDGIECADYMYYKTKYSKGIFLEEKETHEKGKNIFYHALESKENQADTFLIDCTDSKFNKNEIYERLNKVFKYKETKYVKTIIVKKGKKLFGVFTRK